MSAIGQLASADRPRVLLCANRLPLGALGELAAGWLVGRDLDAVFDFRRRRSPRQHSETSLPGGAAEIEGLRFVHRVQSPDVTLRLRCVGLLRYKVFIKAVVDEQPEAPREPRAEGGLDRAGRG